MLINQRNQWKNSYEQGKVPVILISGRTFSGSSFEELLAYITHLEQGGSKKELGSYILSQYRKHRNSESWRSTRTAEQLCEYILFLENNIKE